MQPANGQNQKPNMQGIAAPSPASAQPFKAQIVSNIPVKAPAPAAPAPKPADEDEELDKIMADVGHNLDQLGKKNGKKHLSMFKRRPKPAKPAAANVQPPPAASPAQPPPPDQPSSPAAEAEKKPPPTPAKQHGAPVMAISLAVLVTGALIAAAYYAYK